jgi:hypothetical protein
MRDVMEMDASGVSKFFETTGAVRKTLAWRRIRAGWYVAPLKRGERGDQPFIHIRRADDKRPRWGWDVYYGDNDYELPPRERLVFSGLADLGWAKLEAEDKYGEYRESP